MFIQLLIVIAIAEIVTTEKSTRHRQLVQMVLGRV